MIGVLVTLLGGNDQDAVAILDGESFEQLFTDAQPMKLLIDERKTATKFQVEDGSSRSDHVIDNGVEIQIDFLLNENVRQTFQAMRQAYLDNRLLTVQTKVASYDNMLITDFPHDELAHLGNTIVVPIRLMEWRQVTPEYGDLPASSVADIAQSSTADRGNQQTQESGRDGSILYGIFN